jgi:hypothetical protein
LGDGQSFVPLATGIPAAPDGNVTTYLDLGADIFAASRFYRVRVCPARDAGVSSAK